MALIPKKSKTKPAAAATTAAAVNPAADYVLPRGLARRAVADSVASGDRGTDLLRPREYLGNEAARSLRDSSKTIQAIRQLKKTDGMMSSATFNYGEVANSKWKAYAYDAITGEFVPEATQFLMTMLGLMDSVPPLDIGFNDRMSLQQVVESLLDEVITTNACAMEMVLNKAYLPERFVVVPYESLTKVNRGDGSYYLEQRGSGDPVKLDIPTFFMSEFHVDANATYATPMMTAALNSTFHFMEFIDDMRRVMRKSGHGRVLAKLDAEKVRRTAPQNIQQDPAKMQAYMAQVRDELAQILKDVEPEDAIVFYDAAEVKVESVAGDKSDYKEILQALSGMTATSMKTNPSMLGLRLAGSQSLSNTESLVFLRTSAGVRRPVSTVLGRAFTLALRLYGFNVYVSVEFDSINLRPEDELEAFKTMREQRVYTQLSLGRISDAEANQMLGLGPLPAGAPVLSGTMFLKPGAPDASKASPNNGAQEKAMQSDAPNNAGGASQ